MQQIKESLKTYSVKKSNAPNSERSYWIQQIADLTGMRFLVIFGKVRHLQGREGTKVIREMYESACQASSNSTGKAVKFWEILKRTKI